MDYTTLIADKNTAGSIANWGNSSQLQSVAPTIIDEAQSFVYRRLRHWRMLTEIPLTITAGNDYLDLSSITNYLEDKTLFINGLGSDGNVYNQRIWRKTPEEVKAYYCFDSSGNRVQQIPTCFYNNGLKLKFDSPANIDYPTELMYYAQPAALSALNNTNWLTIYYPRMLRCALMAGATEFMKDAGMGNYDRTYWDSEAEKEIAMAQIESDGQFRSTQVGAIMI